MAVEAEDGAVFPFAEESPGTYAVEGMIMDGNQRYRLQVNADGKKYTSEFVDVTYTPPIDSVTWHIDEGDLEIRVNTHDSENLANYYLWEYEETWMYTSAIPSHFIFDNGVVFDRNENIFTCWKTSASTQILITSSAGLSDAVISNFPITRIPLGSVRLRLGYVIMVAQYALTADAYQYWQALKNNVTATGGFFDAQPARITGNIRCITNPEEPVIGYFSVASASKELVMIRPEVLPRAPLSENTGYEGCPSDTLLLEDVPAFTGGKLLGTAVKLEGTDILIGYIISPPQCIDCRIRGGVNKKPSFWPN